MVLQFKIAVDEVDRCPILHKSAKDSLDWNAYPSSDVQASWGGPELSKSELRS